MFVVLPIGGAVYSAIDESRGERPAGLSRAGSVAVDGAPSASALPLGEEPVSYAVTYRSERYGGARVQRSEDRLEIRRPLHGRVTSLLDGRVVSTRTSRLGALTIATDAGPRTLVSPPAPATSDIRLSPVLADALEEGYAELRERRRVLGRLCQVYRVGTSVSAGQLVPVRASAEEHADVCVDQRGLLLEEVWVKDGKPLQRRIATELDVDPTLDDSRFVLPGEVPVIKDDAGFFRRMETTSGFEGTGYRLARSPEGFGYEGRWLVQPPRLGAFGEGSGEADRPPEQVSIVDVWTRGPDLVVFSQTIAATFSALPAGSLTAERLDLGPIGEAATVLDLRSVEVRVELPEGRFLRIAGTLRRDELVALARTLRAESGTGPVFVDG